MTTEPATGHAIHRVDAADLARYATLGWTGCTRRRCEEPIAYYTKRRNSVGALVRDRLCERHAKNFARLHRLSLTPEPQAAPEVLDITTASGQKHQLCPSCRHWLGRTDLIPGQCVPSCSCKQACHRAEAA
jgi:hypothetical protein